MGPPTGPRGPLGAPPAVCGRPPTIAGQARTSKACRCAVLMALRARSTSADERIQAFGIGVTFGATLTPHALDTNPTPFPYVTETRTALACRRCGRTQKVATMRAATKAMSVAAIAGSVRRISVLVAVPSANAKPA
jgi:hypothetical protein